MARRAFIIFAVAALAFAQIVVAQDAQDAQATPEHKDKGGKYFLEYSPFNPTYGTYLPIGSDKTNVYYRIRVGLTVVDYFRSSPLAPNLALTQASASGDIVDHQSTVQVGRWDSLSTQVNSPAAIGANIDMLSQFSIVLGTAAQADSLVVSGGWTFNGSELRSVRSNLAITGGTGRFTGAMGELHVSSGSLGDRQLTAVLAFAVPYSMPM